MKRTYFLFAGLLLSLSSCQKVIDVNLNDSNPNYVIEAPLYEGTNDFVVGITKTTSYFGTEAPPGVENATVNLIDQNNVNYPVNSIGNGIYKIPQFTPIQNSRYTLKVNVDGKEFEAVSTFPQHTSLDSLSSIQASGPFGGGKKDFLVFAHFQDEATVRNYYRVKATINNQVQNKPIDYYLFDDLVRDGQYIDAPLFTYRTQLDDSVEVELLGMDANVYDYFNTLSEVLTSDVNTSAAPANPNSNFTNGALGYFGAFTSSKQSIKIKN